MIMHERARMIAIQHQVGVKASVADVFAAITTLDGLSGWWAPTTGSFESNGVLDFHFGEHIVSMQVFDIMPNASVRWRCVGGNEQWQGTEIEFVLRESPQQVIVDFTHGHWREATELFCHCSTKWATFMLSLKSYVETGQGAAFPNDIPINYS